MTRQRVWGWVSMTIPTGCQAGAAMGLTQLTRAS